MDPEKPEEGAIYKAVRGWCNTLNDDLGHPAYAYLFKRRMPGDDAGAFHSSELWYVFGTYGRCWRLLGEADAALSERMTDAWASFFKTGAPAGDWACCTKEAPVFKEWDV